jgi:hypothetical protein
MQPISSFNPNLGTALLFIGPPGGGKTSLALSLFPKTYVIVADLNFKSGVDYVTKIGRISNVIGFDTITVDEKNLPVPVTQWYDRFLAKLGEAMKNPDIDCIVLDSATFIADFIIARVGACTDPKRIVIPAGKESYSKWLDYLLAWRGIILQLRQSGKKLIMVAHEKKEKDESDGIYKYQIMLDGQIREKLPNMFSDVWRCEVEETSPGQHRWMVRTLGNARHELKNTLGLKSFLPADEVVKIVSAMNIPVANPEGPVLVPA